MTFLQKNMTDEEIIKDIVTSDNYTEIEAIKIVKGFREIENWEWLEADYVFQTLLAKEKVYA